MAGEVVFCPRVPNRWLKYILLLISLTRFLSISKAQTDDNSDKQDFIDAVTKFAKTQRYVQQPAEFKGGLGALYDYLQTNITYPKEAKKEQLAAQVFVSFVIDWKTGLPKNVKIAQSSNKVFDSEAIRLIKNMPAWEPAKKNGWPVGMLLTIPIYFHLN